MRATVLHTNDLHGRVEQLARIATLVRRIRQASPWPVVYVDAGDVEETTNRLSNLTKGVAMQPLLAEAGCQAACVGNAVWLRYGAQALADHAAAASFPLLLSNLAPVGGVQPSAIIDGVGFVGVTDAFRDFLQMGDYGLSPLDEVETVRQHARDLRRRGARRVAVLSHLGLGEMAGRRGDRISDRELAAALTGEIDLIIGGHSHDLLPGGERVADVLIAQAGSLGEHLGRIEIDGSDLRASLVAVGEDVPPDRGLLQAAADAEAHLAASLNEVIAHLDRPLDASWIADVLRQRMDADVGLATAGAALDRTLPRGALLRGDLWDACRSTGNPGVVAMTGEQLLHVIERGADPSFQQTTAGPLRGRPRGPLHVASPGDVAAGRTYLVAGTDWELEPYGGMVEPDWSLHVRYDFPTILREAVEQHLRELSPAAEASRIDPSEAEHPVV
jgi:2',3'-cyclic-nucleotide 2'-phosphodiesterase (5'-nucleotidase family)